MKPFLYYKIKARRAIRGKLFKPGIVGAFSVILAIFVSIYSALYDTDNEIYNIVIDVIKNILFVQPFTMGCTVFYMNFINNKNANVGDVFDGYKYILKLVPYVIISLGVSYLSYYLTDVIFHIFIDGNSEGSLIGELMLYISTIVPLIVNTYLSFTAYILYDEKISGIKAIIKSIKMTKGHIIYLIAIQFSFFLWILLGITTFGIALVYVIPYIEITLIMVYEDLKSIKNKANKENEERESKQ